MTARVPAGVRAGGRFTHVRRPEGAAVLLAPLAGAVELAAAADSQDGQRIAAAMSEQVRSLDQEAIAAVRLHTYASLDARPGTSEYRQRQGDERACSSALGAHRTLIAAELHTLPDARALEDLDLLIVAQVAARALLARDRVGQEPGWDKAAYDRMSGPWRRFVGPLHPDDMPLDGPER